MAFLSEASSPEPYEPRTYEEALAGHSREQWELAMKEEIESLQENNTWDLTALPPDRKALRGKWVYKLKRGPFGEVLRHKARWVVKGFQQREGLDYNETFASVVKPMSYKALFAIAAAKDLEIEQMDVKTAFLYGAIEEHIYMEQPTGYNQSSSNLVCKLNKALYGLKQSPRVWYNTISQFLAELGFTALSSDLCVFHKAGTYIAVFVDDLLIVGPSKPEITNIKEKLKHRFHMTDLGPCCYYLGMEITRDRQNRTIYLSQQGYIEKVLKDFNMWESSPNATPMETSAKLEQSDQQYHATIGDVFWYQSAVGSLMYAMLGTRPDIAFAVSVVSRYASNPSERHKTAVKRIFRYLRGTTNLRLTFKGDLVYLTGYTDADWAGDRDTRRSTSGYVFNIGSGAISWSSNRQSTVALSTCEAEYIGQTQAAKEAIWLKTLLDQLNPEDSSPVATIIYGDNQGAIALAKNPQFHARTKHIDIQHHFIRQKVDEGKIELQYVPTAKQVADGLTKALCKDKFILFRRALGLEER